MKLHLVYIFQFAHLLINPSLYIVQMKEYRLQADNNHNKKQNTQQHYQEKNFETLSIIEQLMFYYGLIQV